MKHILAVLAFYAKHGGWQSYKTNDKATRNAVLSLQRRGFLEVNEHGQARFTGKVFSK